MTIRYTLGCDLSYEVNGPTVFIFIFIFNVEVARLARHHDLIERLAISPDHQHRSYIVPDIRNRYFSIEAQSGPLNVRYEAEVTLEVFRADPDSVQETPLNQLPLDIMPFLLPSRFVPSDGWPPSLSKNLVTGQQATTASPRFVTGSMTISTTSGVPPTNRPLQQKA